MWVENRSVAWEYLKCVGASEEETYGIAPELVRSRGCRGRNYKDSPGVCEEPGLQRKKL